MKLALVTHPTRPSAQSAARALVEAAVHRGVHVMASQEDTDRFPGAAPWTGTGPDSADAVIAVGGDGTMLEAARIARAAGIPVLGVNAGTVGFLTEVDPTDVSDMLDRLGDGRFTISERMTLRATLPDGTEVDALNDVVTEKAISQHVVGIAVSVAGEPLAEYRADAVIVATPTGSTAYTFSAGGPLLDPGVEALVVTAVAPHNLFGRAVVLGADAVLEIAIVGDRPANVHADGRAAGALNPGESIRVVRGPLRDRIIRLVPMTFTGTVAERFRSGGAR